MKYTHRLIWTKTAKRGNLVGLELDHDYQCFDDFMTRRHVENLLADPDCNHVHLVRI